MKLLPRYLIITCVFVCAACKTLPIPAYITPCYQNDPKLNDCATKNGQEALPTLIKGDRKYRVPVLDPLAVDKLSILNGNGSVAVELVGRKLNITGFKDITIKSSKFDLSKKVIKVELLTPQMFILGDYSIKGSILILPVTGSGYMNITIDNVRLLFTLNYDLVKKADGLEYLVPHSNKMEYTSSKVHFRFDNLFNGNKLLSDNMNNFMNENWEIMNKELGPSVAEAVGDILQLILTTALQDIPYKDVFLTKS